MLRFGNIRTRIIVLTTIPLIAILVTILVTAIHAANGAVRDRVQHSLVESGSVFVQMLTSRRNELVSMAQVTPPLLPLMGVLLLSLIFFVLTPSLVLLLPSLILAK